VCGSLQSPRADWGDGTPLDNSGVIQEVSPGVFQVLGNHTYAVAGWYTIGVQISQGWGAQEATVKAGPTHHRFSKIPWPRRISSRKLLGSKVAAKRFLALLSSDG
jgi:hypothetical protein